MDRNDIRNLFMRNITSRKYDHRDPSLVTSMKSIPIESIDPLTLVPPPIPLPVTVTFHLFPVAGIALSRLLARIRIHDFQIAHAVIYALRFQ